MGGLFIAMLLSVIGFGMIGPGGTHAYAWPARVGFASLIFLPAGYFFMALRSLPPIGGGLAFLAMVIAAISLWIPLIGTEWMRNIHSDVLLIWTAVWGAASLPFLRLAMKGIRKRQL